MSPEEYPQPSRDLYDEVVRHGPVLPETIEVVSALEAIEGLYEQLDSGEITLQVFDQRMRYINDFLNSIVEGRQP